MRDTEPPTTRSLLARIAAALEISPTAFIEAGQRSPAEAGPTPAECEAVMMLFRCIESPARRDAVVRLLREMAEKP